MFLQGLWPLCCGVLASIMPPGVPKLIVALLAVEGLVYVAVMLWTPTWRLRHRAARFFVIGVCWLLAGGLLFRPLYDIAVSGESPQVVIHRIFVEPFESQIAPQGHLEIQHIRRGKVIETRP